MSDIILVGQTHRVTMKSIEDFGSDHLVTAVISETITAMLNHARSMDRVPNMGTISLTATVETSYDPETDEFLRDEHGEIIEFLHVKAEVATVKL